MNPDFDVRAEPEYANSSEWRISMTSNGYQWQTLNVLIADREKAERIAAFLKAELAPEDERSYNRTLRS